MPCLQNENIIHMALQLTGELWQALALSDFGPENHRQSTGHISADFIRAVHVQGFPL